MNISKGKGNMDREMLNIEKISLTAQTFLQQNHSSNSEIIRDKRNK